MLTKALLALLLFLLAIPGYYALDDLARWKAAEAQ